jgi:hypothetical protein
MSGEQLKATGIEKIQRREWHDRAFALLRDYINTAQPGDRFPSDEVRSAITYCMGFDSAPHPNSWGALLSAAAKAGLIERVGFEPSRSPSAHGRIVSVWRKKV